MPFNFTAELIVIALMLVLNAIFAAYEMAIASVSQARLWLLADQKKAGAASALHMKERIEGSLATVQVGITLVGAVAAAVGGAGIKDSLAPYLANRLDLSPGLAGAAALILFVIPLSAFTIIFGELIPKVFAIENKEWVCLRLSPLMKWVFWATSPVVRLFEAVVKTVVGAGRRAFRFGEDAAEGGLQELRAAVTLARTKRLLGAQEERIVLSASLLSRRKIRDILLPAADISMIPASLSLPEALVRAHLDLHTRFPIARVENDPQTIEGYITFKDLVAALKMHAATPEVRGIARPIKRIPGDLVISQVLEQMIRERLHIALVVSGSGAVEGLITLEDIIEELVGDIEDEADSLPAHLHPTSGGWIAGGGVPMGAICSRLGVPWSATSSGATRQPLAGWSAQVLGRSIRKGDLVRSSGLQVTVRKIRRRKLAEAFVRKMPEGPA